MKEEIDHKTKWNKWNKIRWGVGKGEGEVRHIKSNVLFWISKSTSKRDKKYILLPPSSSPPLFATLPFLSSYQKRGRRGGREGGDCWITDCPRRTWKEDWMMQESLFDWTYIKYKKEGERERRGRVERGKRREERGERGEREGMEGEKRWREVHLRVQRHVQQPHCWSKMYSVPSPNSLLAPLGPLERSMEGEERSTFWLWGARRRLGWRQVENRGHESWMHLRSWLTIIMYAEWALFSMERSGEERKYWEGKESEGGGHTLLFSSADESAEVCAKAIAELSSVHLDSVKNLWSLNSSYPPDSSQRVLHRMKCIFIMILLFVCSVGAMGTIAWTTTSCE